MKNLNLGPGGILFSFTTVPGTHFTILSSTNVMLSLEVHEAKDASLARLSRRSLGENIGGKNAMVSLRRRLIHIEKTAERVAALAAKAITKF